MPFFSPWWYLFWAFNKRHAWNQRGKGQPFILDEGRNQLLVSTQNNAHLHLLIWSQEGGHTLDIIIWDLWAKSHNEMQLLFICSFFWLKNFENSGKYTEASRNESWKYHWPPTWHQLLRYKYTHRNFVGASRSETWTYQMLTKMSVPGSSRRLESVSWSNRTQLFRSKLFQVLHLSPRRSLWEHKTTTTATTWRSVALLWFFKESCPTGGLWHELLHWYIFSCIYCLIWNSNLSLFCPTSQDVFLLSDFENALFRLIQTVIFLPVLFFSFGHLCAFVASDFIFSDSDFTTWLKSMLSFY